jgi:hypothetical protein
MAGKCYTIAFTSGRGTTHYRVDQETGVRSQEDATKYTKPVADFLRRPGEVVRMARQSHTEEDGDLVDDDGEA